MAGITFVYVDTVYGFYGYSFSCLVGCFSTILCTPAVLSVVYACVLYYCICTCSAQLSMFHMERHSRNTLSIIIIIQRKKPIQKLMILSVLCSIVIWGQASNSRHQRKGLIQSFSHLEDKTLKLI